MRSADRAVLAGLLIAGLIAAFWFVILSPKRDEASKLSDEVAALEESVATQEQLVAEAQQARDDFDRNYQRLVVLGKAVPEDEDTSSMFVQLQEIAERSSVEFAAIELVPGNASAAPVATPAQETTTDQAQPADSGSEQAPPSQQGSAPATEAAAADLPIGATVGPAGLPVMPYKLRLRGSFFELADFLAGVDRLVHSRRGRDVVDGRLITIDGFGLAGNEEEGFEVLTASLALTTFLTPADQGLTAGATPAGPAVLEPGAPTPASNTTPAP
jgi:Tfp pilus assembly protein PilO